MSIRNPSLPLLPFPVPKAVLFDFDGVIADSHTAHRAAWHSAAKEIWRTEPDPYPAHLSGLAPRSIAQYFCDKQNDGGRTEEYLNLKLQHLLGQAEPPPLLPGVRELFNRLRERCIPFGIASNAPVSFLKAVTEKHNLRVQVVLGVENYTKPKPDPQPYLMLAKLLGIAGKDRSQTVIFEDSLTGMQAAAAAEMYPVGVRTAYSDAELREKGAQTTVRDLAEFCEVVF